MHLATLSSCSMRSRSILSCSRRCSASALRDRSPGSILGDLASHYAVDEDKQRIELLAGGHQAHPLSSVMDRACGEGSHHLLPFGQLLLDDIAGVGVGSMILGVCPQVAFAAGPLAG